MEFRNEEVKEIEHTVNEAAELQVIELKRLELTLVGGGIGDVIVG